jgi:outer membrane receptor protein involved in Fe transport
MAKPLTFGSLLLISTALVTTAATAQSAPADSSSAIRSVPQPAPEAPAPADQAQEAPDISIPGGDDIVVRGRAYIDPSRDTSQVLTVLSTADIARTGEGDIAGALGRTTGLSVVGNGFVYVRGLGDRYSLALLNGSPLPSPEPLKRVVPLDIFPTNIVASSLVQKSYSVNFPGEFGGGVINLTTKSIPAESFLTVGGSIGADSETTGLLGYTYYGSKSDWTGFDNGERDLPPALRGYLASGQRISEGTVNTQAIAGQLVTGRNGVVQRNTDIPFNFGASISGGTSFDVFGDATLGVIATFGYSNKWRTRDTIQQTPGSSDLSTFENNFRRVITDNRVVVNALVGYGLEFGENKIRWTNVYIRDTLKQARLGIGSKFTTNPTATFLQQDTAWFERQLVDTQIVGEFKPTDRLSVDVRGGFANSQREAPDELSVEYFRSNSAPDPLGTFFINRLNNGQSGSAEIAFSDLNEDLWSAGLDVGYKLTDDIKLSAGYAFSDTKRITERRDFLFLAPGGGLPQGPSLFRPDLLLQPSVVNFYQIGLIDANEGNPKFDARLRNNAAYLQATVQVTPEVSINGGVRYEKAKQTVTPVQVFTNPISSAAATRLNNDYLLPAATLTYQLTDEMQIRLNASKTIARPQFRELIFQQYFDPEANRPFFGNPLLVDSQLYNFEGRYEWYFAREQKVSLSGFFKRIDNPIETYASANENGIVSSFANAPRAILYGGEFEVQKHFDLDGSESPFWSRRRIVVIGNYTFTKSKLQVGPNDPVAVFQASVNRASELFRDGAPLTGQSDHIVNFELGLEDRDALSQQTVLITYASKRVTNRGSRSAVQLPDIYERPGLRIDLVARQGIKLFGIDSELKLEARNLTGQNYKEYQTNGTNTVLYNLYDVGRQVTLGWSFTF